MVGILTEENYIKTFWGQQIFISLTERLRTKRISYCEIIDHCYADLDAVFIIAADLRFLAISRSSLRPKTLPA